MNSIITFEDKKFERYILNLLNKNDGPVHAEDVITIRKIAYDDTLYSQHDFDNLSYFTMLEHLDISTTADIDVISSLFQLSYLHLELLGSETLDMTLFSKMTQLRELHISGGDISNMNFINSSSLGHLKQLNSIQFHEFGHIDLKFLEELHELEYFECGWSNSVTSVESISKLTHLKLLYLTDVSMNSIDLLDGFPDSLDLTLLGCTIKEPFDKKKLLRFREREIEEMWVAGNFIWEI